MADDDKGIPESKWHKIFNLANRALRREIERAERKMMRWLRKEIEG